MHKGNNTAGLMLAAVPHSRRTGRERSSRSGAWRTLSLLGLTVISGMSACGYRSADSLRVPLPVRTIAVRTLENDTTTYQVEQILTRALVHELVRRSNLEVVNREEGADAVLSGRVLRVVASPVTFRQSAFATTFLVTVEAQVEVTERATGRALFRRNRYVFQERYAINAEVEDFFSEMNPALERLARDFSASVVASLTEDF
ncbi:MAG TPA: LptE family protein [Acidobacteriota bacterium]|nr:LptE family protein [Acidobacteriota bacterium]